MTPRRGAGYGEGAVPGAQHALVQLRRQLGWGTSHYCRAVHEGHGWQG